MQEMQDVQAQERALLTADDVMRRLGVDRSTVYRMAMDGRLPAVKVGRQWRFHANDIDRVLGSAAAPAPRPRRFTPQEALDLVALAAERLGVMMVVTDMDGRPLMEPVNPCPWFADRGADARVLEACTSEWRLQADDPNLSPRFTSGMLGFECARAFVRDGNELVAMVLAGGVAPAGSSAPGLYTLDDDGRREALDTLPRVAAALSRVGTRPQREWKEST